MLRRHLWILISASLATGCAPANDTDTAADEAAIRAVIADEVQAANAGDADAFIAVFTDDAVAMPPAAPAVAGEANRQFSRDMFEQFDIKLGGYTDEAIIISGDLAVHQYSFSWTLTPKAGGDAVSEQGTGLHVLNRQPDGSWKITHDIWNTDAASEEM